MHEILVELVALAAGAVIAVPLFNRLGLGAILAYLFAGVIIGPDLLKLVHDADLILHFSELGVVLLLFVIGLELEPSRFWAMRKSVFGMGLLQVVVTGSLFALLLQYWLGSVEAAFVAGFALALSSTAFGVQILEENRQLDTSHGQGAFAILMFQDMAVVPILAALSLLAPETSSLTGDGGAAHSQAQALTLGAFLKGAGILAAIVVGGRYGVRFALRVVAESGVREVFTAMALLIVLGTALLVEWAGFSMGMGAFMAGMLLATSEYRHQLESDLQPFKGLLLGLFFMAVGMSLDLATLAQWWPLVLGLAIAKMLLKGGVLWSLARLFGYPGESARNIAVTLPQGGEFAFVIFATSLGQGILEPQQVSILNATVILSMALTPVGFLLNQRFFRTYSEISERPHDISHSTGIAAPKVIVAGFGRVGQIISRFLSTEGVQYTLLDHSAEQVEVARKFGNKVFYGDASREPILHAAGAEHAEIFVLAIDDVESSVRTAEVVLKNFPKLRILARVRNRSHAIRLMELGVHEVFRETYGSALEMSSRTLMALGQSANSNERRIQLFREHDEKVLRKQFDLRNDDKEFLSYTKQANLELEKILRLEAEGRKADTNETSSWPEPRPS